MARCRNDIADAEGYLHLVSSMLTEDQGHAGDNAEYDETGRRCCRSQNGDDDLLDGSIL